MKNIIEAGDYVLLYSLTKKRKWLVKVEERKFSTDLGLIDLTDLLGKSYGEYIYTSKKAKLKIIDPTPYDFILNSERPTQIVYPKDIGYLILRLGISHDSKILEVGTGSGGLTTGFAWFLSEEGEIKTYERRKEFLTVAKKNILRIKPRCKITFINQDFREVDIEEEYYDLAFADIDSPWTIIDKIYRALRPSGRVGFLLPTYNQVDKLSSKINKYFIDVEAVEIYIRNIRMKKGRVRPEFNIIGFTSVIVTGIKY